ncbi:MAG: hypothetical protein WHT09_06740 [Thermogutta sp.]
MTTFRSLREDLYGYVDQLREALADPALNEFQTGTPSPEAKQAAANVAVALGYCRVFGLDAGEDDGTLPPLEAIAAIEALEERLSELAEAVETLPQRWDDAPVGEEDAVCADLLEQRMDLWVAMAALGEAACEAFIDADPLWETLHDKLQGLAEKIEVVDRQMQQREILELLSTLVGTELLNNWRQLLVEPYRSFAPYWLDGTLEEIDEELQKRFEQKSAWLSRLPPRRAGAAAAREQAARRTAEIILATRVLSVAAETSNLVEPLAMLSWRSPDRQYYAATLWPSCHKRGQELKLRVFRTQDNQPATELAGAAVEFAGVQSQLTPNAEMPYKVDDVYEFVKAHSPGTVPLQINGIPWEEEEPDTR